MNIHSVPYQNASEDDLYTLLGLFLTLLIAGSIIKLIGAIYKSLK